MTRNYRWTWNARIQKDTLAALQSMAGELGFIVTQASRYQGQPSPPDMLDALATAYRLDPAATLDALRALLVPPDAPDA
jgi:hypothetical protein